LLVIARKNGKRGHLFNYQTRTVPVYESIGSDGGHIETALERWASRLSAIPLNREVQSAAKVVIIGGLNLIFVHQPVSEYFLNQTRLLEALAVQARRRRSDKERKLFQQRRPPTHPV
jgi:hypothetical protein